MYYLFKQKYNYSQVDSLCNLILEISLDKIKIYRKRILTKFNIKI